MIIADYTPKSVTVKILDAYECGGVTWAVVQALAGKPFVGGDKWPVATEFATLPAADLAPVAFSVELPSPAAVILTPATIKS
jgi:hypothetical protein